MGSQRTPARPYFEQGSTDYLTADDLDIYARRSRAGKATALALSAGDCRDFQIMRARLHAQDYDRRTLADLEAAAHSRAAELLKRWPADLVYEKGGMPTLLANAFVSGAAWAVKRDVETLALALPVKVIAS